MSDLKQRLLSLFNAQEPRSLTLRQLLRLWSGERVNKRHLGEAVEALVAEGRLRRLRGQRYALAASGPSVSGTLSLHRDGYAFLLPGDGGEDVYIPRSGLGDAFHGDRVRVRVTRRSPRGRREGVVEQVLERPRETVVGLLAPRARGWQLEPTDPRLPPLPLVLEPPPAEEARGAVVEVRLRLWPTAGAPGRGAVTAILGAPDDPAVEIAIAARRFGLRESFPPEVLAAAERIPQGVLPGELVGRGDLRERPLVTIDGETAKDFDDAVCARREADGGFRLWVAIADVGHYVPEGSLLDREAQLRGTSVYFPGTCLPMLPEALSNGICSLNPGVERLVLVAELGFDPGGRRRAASFYPAVMRSAARLTYTRVAPILAGADVAAELKAEVRESLLTMGELAGRLLERRQERGSLDFDLPEAEIILDLTGRPEQILRAERTFAHRLIEELMLAANEAVAAHLAGRGIPFPFRIHEPPAGDHLDSFNALLLRLGEAPLPKDPEPADFQRALARLAGRSEERLAHHLALRSLKQARYAPDNPGHFGLAASHYCHFTSPIRRYPDLVVHRQLRRLLDGESAERLAQRLPPDRLGPLCEQTSAAERRAMEAERDAIKLKQCQYMAQHLGEVYAGHVASVHPFGLFVELVEVFVDGLVRSDQLGDEFWQFDEQELCLFGTASGRMLRIGDPLRVQVAAVRIPEREIDFRPEWVEASAPGAPRAIKPRALILRERRPQRGGRPRRPTRGRR